MKSFLLLLAFAWVIVKFWGFFTFFGICTVICYFKGFLHLIRVKRIRDRICELMLKYDDEEIVSDILNRKFWIGQTASQLLDSLGNPVDISEWRSTKDFGETWKYLQTGKNRYALKIYLENDEVSGWDKK